MWTFVFMDGWQKEENGQPVTKDGPSFFKKKTNVFL